MKTLRTVFDQGFVELAHTLESATRARVVARLLRSGRDPGLDGFGRIRSDLLPRLVLPETQVVATTSANDPTRKLKFMTSVGTFEAVLIPTSDRTTLCVSSQVGCRRGCTFCATGRMGQARNVPTELMIAQLWHGIRLTRSLNWPRLRNVVFMGMGEPLDNFRNVERAIALMTDSRIWGIGPRHITVSTVVPSEKALIRCMEWPTHLAWSLHCARDEVRRTLVPTQRLSVEQMANCFRSHRPGRPPFVEITLIEGVNDTARDAESAGRLMAGFRAQVRFNLLPVNSTGAEHRPPSSDAVDEFARILSTFGHRAMARKARGQDFAAACGQLVTLSGLQSR
ncbi:MAG: radical SAM protein [Myxococcota bacterium]